MPKHELRDAQSGRYEATRACDACGKPAGNDYCTDAEVCGDGDGPGFNLCARKRCCAKRDALDVETRRALYTRQRAENEKRNTR